jgi:ectoine hydroxylase-related dioxygenase (phytanoyl-CoA dioxygenase family)
MPTQLSDTHFEEFCAKGYLIVPNFISKSQCQEMATALRKRLKPWDEIKDEQPQKHTDQSFFPYPERCLNQAILNPAALQFARRWHGTHHLHYRQGLAMVRYPGFKGDSGQPHIDNGNNSLLPLSLADRHHAQIVFWIFPEDVDKDQAPMRLIASTDGGNLKKAELAAVPAGSAAIFHTYTWHSASDYLRPDGQRYSWSFGFGRADHYWEGVKHYTDQGQNPHFQAFIASLTAEQRSVFWFPPPDHPYYTAQTLAALEKQYPGWNQHHEYHPT